MDKFILTEKNYNIYKKYLKLEKEKHEQREKIYNPLKSINMDRFEFSNKDIINKNYYENDLFHIKEKGDNLLNNWIIRQKDPIIIFLSEFIPGTKISKEIEKFRPIIKTTPTISIEEYRKKKKLGEEGVTYLKKLKDKYGIIVLKVLWANLNF
jgi:hypothetical protein